MNFDQDIMVKLRRMGDGLGDAVLTLLWSLASPGLEKKFSIENFYAAYGYITNEEDEPGLKLITKTKKQKDGFESVTSYIWISADHFCIRARQNVLRDKRVHSFVVSG